MIRQTESEASEAKQLRFLLAEPRPGALGDVLRSLLRAGSFSLELTSVSTLSSLTSTISLVHPEVIFFDLALDPADPLSVVRNLRRANPGVPLIVLADAPNEETARKSLREGAADYLLKDHCDARAVERVLRGALERCSLSGLTGLPLDPLTGLYNKEAFSALAARAMETAKASRGRMILLTAEIENTDSLRNDQDSNAWTEALRDVAAMLRSSFRRTDVVARLGEAEFAVLAIDALEPTCSILLQRVRIHLAALNQSRTDNSKILLKLSASFWSAVSQERFHALLFLIGNAGNEPRSGKANATVERDASKRAG